MTEEAVEFLYAIGRQDLIIGVSSYVRRPPESRKLPTISAFTHANLKKILSLEPDLVLGFSDIQKDIARDLIGAGVDVYIANHRSIQGILDYLLRLGGMLGESKKTGLYLDHLISKLEEIRKKALLRKVRPKVYIEEWDEPTFCGINWFSECIELCGGVDIFRKRSLNGSLAMDRAVEFSEVIEASPDIIFGCWCGKKVDIDSIQKREGFAAIPAVKNNHIFELEPEIFLQPGPAPIVSGLDILFKIFDEWEQSKV